jgi:hypothetical protein
MDGTANNGRPLVSLWLGAGLAAAFIAALIEVVSVLARSSVAASRASTLIATALLVLLPAVASAPLLGLVSAPIERLIAPRVRAPRLASIALAVLGAAALAAFAGDVLGDLLQARAPLLDFGETLRSLSALLLFVVFVVLLAVAFAAVPLLERWMSSSWPSSAGRWLVVGVLLLVSLVLHGASHEMASIHGGLRIVPFAAVGLWSLIVALRVALPPGLVPRARTLWAVIAVFVTAGLLANALSPAARIVVHRRAAAPSVLVSQLRSLADFDRDGAAPPWLGGADCAAFDADIGPRMPDVPGDGVDQDCSGADAAQAPAAAPAGGALPACAGEHAEPMSILLISIDALPTSVLRPEVAPNISRLARRSLWFSRAYSGATSTAHSMIALFSGRPSVAATGPSLAERLRDSHTTGSYYYFRAANELFEPFEVANRQWRDRTPLGAKHELTSADVANGALGFLADEEGAVFLWAHFSDPHAPYTPPLEGIGAPLPKGSGYDRLVGYVDFHVGRLLSGLAASPRASRTMVILTADHGEDFGARGRQGHGPDLFESAIHVPLAVFVPGCPGALIDMPVSHLDIAPTVMAATGTPNGRWTLFDAAAGSPRPQPVVVETWVGGPARAIVQPRHKLIVDVDTGGRLLFDLERDPGEQDDIYGDDPRVTESLEAAYRGWLETIGRE